MPSILRVISTLITCMKAGKKVYSSSPPNKQVLDVNREKHDFFIVTPISKLLQVNIMYMHNLEICKCSMEKNHGYLTHYFMPRI